MKITHALEASLLAAAAVALWGLAPGCGPSVGSYCNKVCDCVGCTDAELDECVDGVEDAKRWADEDGCGSEFDEVLSCTTGELTCNDGVLDADGCESAAERLGKCSSGGGLPGAVTIGAYCAKVCDCIGCSDSELEDCVDLLEDGRKAAADEGCTSQFDILLTCASNVLTCEGGSVFASECDAENEALADCTSNAIGVGKNACELAADQIRAKYEACGKDVPGETGPSECSKASGEKSLCLAACFSAASCDCSGLGDATLCDPDELKVYSDCVGGC